MNQELLKQALDALERFAYHGRSIGWDKVAMDLHEALAAPMLEPVAYLVEGWHDGKLIAHIPHVTLEDAKTSAAVFAQHYTTTKTIPLYATPPAQPAPAVPDGVPDTSLVICPNCCTQFRAIPQDVQRLMIDAGFEPPFVAAPVVREQLTNGEIYTAYIAATNQTLRPQDERLALAFARAIEKAHGITGGGNG